MGSKVELLQEKPSPGLSDLYDSKSGHEEDEPVMSGSFQQLQEEVSHDTTHAVRSGGTAWRQRSHARRVACAATLAVLFALGYFAHSSSSFALGLSRSTVGQCRDPYNSPGYLLYTDDGKQARWIPYTDDNLWDETLRGEDKSKDIGFPKERKSDYVPQAVIDAIAPPSLGTAMLENGTRHNDPALQFLKGKRVTVLGCSLDRNAASAFCHLLHGKWGQDNGLTGLHTCYMADLDFQLMVVFTVGVLELDEDYPRKETRGPPAYKFEDRIQNHYMPRIRALGGDKPDLLLWSGGVWDLLSSRKKLREGHEDTWVEKPISYMELAFQRIRLREIHSFITETFPDVPLMYRPPAYMKAVGQVSTNPFLGGITDAEIPTVNAGMYALRESVRAVMERLDVPLFRWGEKLIGETQYRDPIHFSPARGPEWLYIDMLLYYIRFYTLAQPTHCRLKTAEEA